MVTKEHLMFIGTASNAGKTFLTGFIGKILKEEFNIDVCPFKSQNMSNYATVCESNKEVAIAQAFQAKLMKIPPKADMTALLLKPIGDGRSQLVVRGIPRKIISAKSYYQEIDTLKTDVNKAFENLEHNYEKLVIEGAGSGFELNLKNQDLANQYLMKKPNVNIVLVANIENGGVFPAILGSYQLMSEDEKKRFKGVIINNFLGDVSLFDEGRKIIEEWGIPVLGVIPHIQYGLDCEDSLSYIESIDPKCKNLIQIGIIKYPRASNINDIEPLVHDINVQVTFISQRTNLNIFDKLILPGSRSVLDDLRWMKEIGIAQDLKTFPKDIYAICGGYQMLHEELIDFYGSENSLGKADKEEGIGLIFAKVEFMKEKVLKRQDYTLFDNIQVHGFEMHTGVSNAYPLYYNSPQIKGSVVHEIFHNDNFRSWWLTHNTNIELKEWKFEQWKNNLQNIVAKELKVLIDWERLLS